MAASVFCEHKKLRTSCPACKATAVPPPSRDLKPLVEEKPARAPREPKPARAPRDPTDADAMSEDPGSTGRRGPGKPLMPTRQRPKKVGNRSEAEHADAWWVKKRE
jgi:hypothetical protein